MQKRNDDLESPHVNLVNGHYDESNPKDKKTHCFGKLKKSHCIIVTVLSVIIVLVIVILLVIFVGGKAIAQQGVDGSQASVASMTLNEAYPSGDAVDVTIKGSLSNASPHKTTVSGFTMTMLYDGKPFAAIDYPEMTLPPSAVYSYEINNTLKIVDQDAFNIYSQEMLSNPTIRVTSKGTISASAMGLSFSGLKFEKEIQLNGLGGFNNPPPIVIAQNVFHGEQNSLFLTMNVSMFNPSSFTIANTGKLTMGMYYQKKLLGYATTSGDKNAIPRGQFYLTIIGEIQRTSDNVFEIEQLLSKFTSGEDVTMSLQGINTTVALFSPGVKKLVTVTSLNGLATLSTQRYPERVPVFQNLINSPFNRIINPMSMGNLLLANNISNSPWMIQGVFSPMPATMKQGVMLPNFELTAYQLTYNPLNTSATIHSIEMDVYLNKAYLVPGQLPSQDKIPERFRMGTAKNPATPSTTPLLQLKALETVLFPQSLIIDMGSAMQISELYHWVYDAYNLSNVTGLPIGMTVKDCQTQGLSAAQCGGAFAVPMEVTGRVELTMGNPGYRTFVNVTQIFIAQCSLVNMDAINITTMTYLPLKPTTTTTI